MRVYTRYKPTRRARRLHSGAYWLLALAGLAFLLWVFLRSARWVELPGRPEPPRVAATSNGLAPREEPPLLSKPASTGEMATVVTSLLARLPAFTNLIAPMVTSPPPMLPDSFLPEPKPVGDILEAQLALIRQGISPGSVDGVAGSQTREALRAFQRQERLPVTGELDAATRTRLKFVPPARIKYKFTTNDLARLLPVSPSWLGKSRQPRLDYESALELVAERSQSHPRLIRAWNPGVDWGAVAAGDEVEVPNVTPPVMRDKAAWVRIRLSAKVLEAFDARSNLLAHFPCSIARLVEKRPVGSLEVVVIAHNPNYTFNPAVFPESEEGRRLGRKLVLPSGPNNPVGTAWIGLSRAGYGIHGTPRPEEVGRTESHGCFRLANWNAEFLTQLVSVGTTVLVEP